MTGIKRIMDFESYQQWKSLSEAEDLKDHLAGAANVNGLASDRNQPTRTTFPRHSLANGPI
jgi:hypothetical protein